MKCKLLVSKIYKFLFNKNLRFSYLANKGLLWMISDEKFIKNMYKIHMGKDLNLNTPTTYTEKLQWLKLYDRNPKYTLMVDKYSVKQYVADCIGEEYVIPNLGIWSNFDEIDFETLPNQFVLKCTHDSGSIVICKDKKEFDYKKARNTINKYLKRKYFDCSREWPYKDVVPRIIAERYMEDSEDKELRDYKFFTFNGIPKILYITQGRESEGETFADFFDMDFNHLPFSIDHNMASTLPHPPKNFELMQNLAAKLSKGTPQLRVDFYEVNGQVYFGEMTFFHCSGLVSFKPSEWDKKIGEWVVLPYKLYEKDKKI